MRVGLSLLTLVPGEVGGAETSARGLARGLAEVGTLDYVAFTRLMDAREEFRKSRLASAARANKRDTLLWRNVQVDV